MDDETAERYPSTESERGRERGIPRSTTYASRRTTCSQKFRRAALPSVERALAAAPAFRPMEYALHRLGDAYLQLRAFSLGLICNILERSNHGAASFPNSPTSPRVGRTFWSSQHIRLATSEVLIPAFLLTSPCKFLAPKVRLLRSVLLTDCPLCDTARATLNLSSKLFDNWTNRLDENYIIKAGLFRQDMKNPRRRSLE